jgi:hypothetical protein
VYALDYAGIVAQQPACPIAAAMAGLVEPQQRSADPTSATVTGNSAPGSRIEWVGQPLHGPIPKYQYSNVNVYRSPRRRASTRACTTLAFATAARPCRRAAACT